MKRDATNHVAISLPKHLSSSTTIFNDFEKSRVRLNNEFSNTSPTFSKTFTKLSSKYS